MIKPDRTTYFFIAPHPVYGTFAPIKMATEYPLGEGQTQEEAWDDAKMRAEAWAAKNFQSVDLVAAAMMSYGQAGSAKDIIQERTPEDQRIAVLIADIYACESIEKLNEYGRLAKTYPLVQAAFDQMTKKLSK